MSFQFGAELFGNDLRHGRGNVLAHVGLAAGDRDDPVRRDRIPDAGIEIGGCGERLVGAEQAGNAE